MARKRMRKKIRNIRQRLKNEELSEAQRTRLQARKQKLRSKIQAGKQGKGLNNADAVNDPGKLYNLDTKAEDTESWNQVKWGNADQVNPFGSQTVRYDQATGKPILEQAESGAQQAIREGGQDLTMQGQGVAKNLVGNYNQFQFDAGDARGRVEGAVYDRLTKNFDRDRGRELESKEQELFNKGIQYSDDPESRYQKEIRGIQDRYDAGKLDAQNQAIMTGGGEMQRDYGINLGTHQQGVADTGFYQNMGFGYQAPQYQGYQAPNYDVAAPSEYAYKSAQLGQQGKALDNEIALGLKDIALKEQIANRPPAGGADGGEPPFP